MFVRKKTTKSGTVKHYLVECRREAGKVRQKVLYYLGRFQTPEEELAYWQRLIEGSKRDANSWRERAAATREEPLIGEFAASWFARKGEPPDAEFLESAAAAREAKALRFEAVAAESDARAARHQQRRDKLQAILDEHR
jgi:hypothetical protein